MSNETKARLITWQYIYGMDIEPVYWLAEEVSKVNWVAHAVLVQEFMLTQQKLHENN